MDAKEIMTWDWMIQELKNGNIRISYYGDSKNGLITAKKIREALADELEEIGYSHG